LLEFCYQADDKLVRCIHYDRSPFSATAGLLVYNFRR